MNLIVIYTTHESGRIDAIRFAHNTGFATNDQVSVFIESLVQYIIEYKPVLLI